MDGLGPNGSTNVESSATFFAMLGSQGTKTWGVFLPISFLEAIAHWLVVGALTLDARVVITVFAICLGEMGFIFGLLCC